MNSLIEKMEMANKRVTSRECMDLALVAHALDREGVRVNAATANRSTHYPPTLHIEPEDAQRAFDAMDGAHVESSDELTHITGYVCGVEVEVICARTTIERHGWKAGDKALYYPKEGPMRTVEIETNPDEHGYVEARVGGWLSRLHVDSLYETDDTRIKPMGVAQAEGGSA